jgi:three-Cys-motif partner protein
VDAFAGTGYRNLKNFSQETIPLLYDFITEENQSFLKGSARIALDVEPPFKEYLFIEQDADYARELQRLKSEFSNRRPHIIIENREANSFLLEWVISIDWRFTRAVVFLDPYGMAVEWEVIQALGKTKAVDLWILFPLGVAVNRLLTKYRPPTNQWARALTRIFGTDEWQDVFYPSKKILTLFGEEEVQSKEADFEKIGEYFNQRLKTAFKAVAPNPLALRNSKNNPIYLLCFASANPKGASTAVKIASHILEK